jgi:uncharacterized protein
VPEADPAPGLVARAVLAILRGYKLFLSPLFAGSCRFTPSCADYTAEAVRRHGGLAGMWLGVRRLARCRPFGPWGPDPVPPAFARLRPDQGPRRASAGKPVGRLRAAGVHSHPKV